MQFEIFYRFLHFIINTEESYLKMYKYTYTVY